MTILGVDLGTTNSLAVVYKEGKPSSDRKASCET